jgi:uncharacterized membrane protein
MNLPEGLVATPWAWTFAFGFAALVAQAARTAPWVGMADSQRLHVYAGGIVACMLLWTIAGNVGRGLSFHLLGATVLTLMFGARLAIVGLTIALAGVTLAGLAGWQALGLNGLLMIALPVAVSRTMHAVISRRLPNHFFIYVFGSAFLNGGLAMAANGIATTVLLWWAGVRSGAYLFTEYLPYYLFLSWGEALVTGMLMTMLVVYRPRWVGSFDDARYLAGR